MSWLRVEVIEVRPGAAHEGVLYDGDVVVRTASGASFALFDMTPMVARGVSPGERLEVAVSLLPTGARRGGAAVLAACDIAVERSGWQGFRDDLLARPLCRLATPDGDVLISPSELPPGLSVGESLAWGDARFNLLAWRRLAARPA
jgi:hypothetical protein